MVRIAKLWDREEKKRKTLATEAVGGAGRGGGRRRKKKKKKGAEAENINIFFQVLRTSKECNYSK